MYRTYRKEAKTYSNKLRRNMTPWERHLWYDFLRGYSVKFYRQRSFGKYIVDFFCRQAMLVVELDGSGHYNEEGKIYDAQRTLELEKLGLKVLRISNLDVSNNFYGVCSYIDRVVKERKGGETHSTASGPRQIVK